MKLQANGQWCDPVPQEHREAGGCVAGAGALHPPPHSPEQPQPRLSHCLFWDMVMRGKHPGHEQG